VSFRFTIIITPHKDDVKMMMMIMMMMMMMIIIIIIIRRRRRRRRRKSKYEKIPKVAQTTGIVDVFDPRSGISGPTSRRASACPNLQE